ncbi:MAG: hypothetical protein KDB03_26150 [Planctomycetales bacterium]|nr:hypothetical protein [Planctomycetales bacterium]
MASTRDNKFYSVSCGALFSLVNKEIGRALATDGKVQVLSGGQQFVASVDVNRDAEGHLEITFLR